MRKATMLIFDFNLLILEDNIYSDYAMLSFCFFLMVFKMSILTKMTR